MDEEYSSSRMFLRYRIGIGMFFLQRGSLSQIRDPEFPASGLPEVTVCNVTSSLVHVTVVPFGIAIDSGAKYLSLLGLKNLAQWKPLSHLFLEKYRYWWLEFVWNFDLEEFPAYL